jgi:hypothetical protein
LRERHCPLDFGKENIDPSTSVVKIPKQPEAIHVILAFGHTSGRAGEGGR